MSGSMFTRERLVSMGISGLFHGLLFWGVCSVSVVYERGPEVDSIVEINLTSYELNTLTSENGKKEVLQEQDKLIKSKEVKSESLTENPDRKVSKKRNKSGSKTNNSKSDNKGGKSNVVEEMGKSNVVEEMNKSEVKGAGSNPAPMAEYINRKPDYPKLARKRGQQGTVQLMVVVSKEGLVTRVEIQRSSGHKLLDREAVKTVKKWRFKPAVESGKNVEGHVIVPIEFRLS